MLEQLRAKLSAIKGTFAVGSFIPDGEKSPRSYFVTAYRLSTLPGSVVLMNQNSIWLVSDTTWNAEFQTAGDLQSAEVTPA